MSEPRHRVLATTLRQRIASGQWAVGTRLPSEVELAERFEVSRATLRRAFSDLEAEQLISRRRRVGTTVIARRPDRLFRMVTDGIEGVLSLARDTELVVTDVRRLRDPPHGWPEVPRSDTGEWLEITGSRVMPGDDIAFGRSRMLVTGRYADIEPVPGMRIGSVFALIEQRYEMRIARVRQSAQAAACPAHDAGALGLVVGEPVMRIDARLYDRDNRLVELSSAVFDPARFRLRTDVRLD